MYERRFIKEVKYPVQDIIRALEEEYLKKTFLFSDLEIRSGSRQGSGRQTGREFRIMKEP
jgi:hypothetical protein